MLFIFYLLVITHFVGDFFLQGKLSTKKKRFNKYMITHAAIMVMMFFVPLVSYPAGRVLTASLFMFAFHLIIDVLKIEFVKLFKLKPDDYLYWAGFGLDQMLHITTIYVVFSAVILG